MYDVRHRRRRAACARISGATGDCRSARHPEMSPDDSGHVWRPLSCANRARWWRLSCSRRNRRKQAVFATPELVERVGVSASSTGFDPAVVRRCLSVRLAVDDFVVRQSLKYLFASTAFHNSLNPCGFSNGRKSAESENGRICLLSRILDQLNQQLTVREVLQL